MVYRQQSEWGSPDHLFVELGHGGFCIKLPLPRTFAFRKLVSIRLEREILVTSTSSSPAHSSFIIKRERF
jgi:hypothetical protein